MSGYPSFLVLTATVAVLGWALYQLRVYPAVAAGYRAKVLCTGIFGSGRAIRGTLWAQVSDDSYWLLRPFRVHVDHAAQTVTASLLGALPRTAVHRDGLGATLVTASVPAPVTLGLGPLLVARSAARGWTTAPAPPGLHALLDAAFEEPVPRRRRRTYGVLVVQDGQIIGERYASGITAEMPLPGWSMAKSVMNALVGILVDEGRLSLAQDALMPIWQAPDPRAAITLEDLLRMRSGLRFSENYAVPWSDVLHMLYRTHDAAGYAASLPLASPPRTTWQYASGTTNILSAIARRTVGERAYHAWPRHVLFDRIGMTSARLEPDASGTFVCSSYMLATLRDWARFGQLFLDRGRWDGSQVLSDDWVRFSTTPTPESPGRRYGAHWWLKLNPDIGGECAAASRIAPDAFFAVGHEGQTLSVIPSRRLVVVRLGAAIHIDAWNQAEFIAAIQDVV